MKTLFIIPPQWYPMNAYLSGAQLVGQLQAKGFEAETRDINIEFYNDILNRENVLDANLRAKTFYESFIEEMQREAYNEEEFYKYLRKNGIEYKTYEEIFGHPYKYSPPAY